MGEPSPYDQELTPRAKWPVLGSVRRLSSISFATVGVVALAAAIGSSPGRGGAAATQDWPPFVLVTGLLLIGLVADGDGLFVAAGNRIAAMARSSGVLFAGATVVVGAVTAVLNLDTSVAFLTPVLVHAGRSRPGDERRLLYGVLLLSNAGSLFLPGSNLTNLIVAGHLGLRGGEFLSHTWLPGLAALVVTAAVVAGLERGAPRGSPARHRAPTRPRFGLGLVAIVAALAALFATASPAVPLAVVGVAAVTIRMIAGRIAPSRVVEVLRAPMLVGLFGIAVALGTLGRAWAGPAMALAHLNAVGTAVFAALASVLVNNLPAASLLAARVPPHPFALLIGLDLGPNLFVTGSLAWLVWLGSARSAGAQPSIATAARIGLVAVPLSMAAALAVLLATGLA